MARILELSGLTFDDVLIVPAYSEVLPRDVDVHTRFSTGIELAIPLISAAMDTVTEFKMAATIAALGGIGVIHKNMSIAEQTALVLRVKSIGMPHIAPIILASGEQSIGEITAAPGYEKAFGVVILEKGEYRFYSKTNLSLSQDQGRKFGSLQNWILASVKSEYEVSLDQYSNMGKYPEEIVLCRDSKHEITGMVAPDHPFKNYHRATRSSTGALRVAAAIGVTKDSIERGDALLGAGVDVLVIDTAHGHSAGVINTVKEMRKHYGSAQLVAGNIATKAAAEALSQTGVDGIKVGIGPGSICTTRIVAGVGIPQLTAIMEVAKCAGPADMPVIADGGVRSSGDLAKALAAGSDAVMMGGIFAGTIESPGETLEKEGVLYKNYRGMGSIGAMIKGSKDRYFQEAQSESKKLVAEGVEGYVPLQGSVKDIVFQLIGGLKSSMGYCGARDIPTFRNNAEFIQVTPASIQESHPHDLFYIKDAPNYRK